MPMRVDVHVHPRLARPSLSASPSAHGRCHSPVAHSVGRDILDGSIVGRCVEPQEFFTPIAVQTKRDIMELLAFFLQAEDGIRDYKVTGVQTCALPISPGWSAATFRDGPTRANANVETVAVAVLDVD